MSEEKEAADPKDFGDVYRSSPYDDFDFSNCVSVSSGKLEISDVIAAISFTWGNLNQAARLLCTSRSTLRKFIDKHKELQLLEIDLREGLLDDIETVAVNSALRGDGASQRFFLQTLGKARGFTTKTESENVHKVDPSLQAMLDRVANQGKSLVETEE